MSACGDAGQSSSGLYAPQPDQNPTHGMCSAARDQGKPRQSGAGTGPVGPGGERLRRGGDTVSAPGRRTERGRRSSWCRGSRGSSPGGREGPEQPGGRSACTQRELGKGARRAARLDVRAQLGRRSVAQLLAGTEAAGAKRCSGGEHESSGVVSGAHPSTKCAWHAGWLRARMAWWSGVEPRRGQGAPPGEYVTGKQPGVWGAEAGFEAAPARSRPATRR